MNASLKLFTLIFFTTPLSLLAHNEMHPENCARSTGIQLDTNLERTANFFDDQSDPCRPSAEVELDKLRKDYLASYPNKKSIQKVRGVSLEGSPEELLAFEDFLGANPPRNWQQKIRGCPTVLCAIERILESPHAALRVLNIAAREGYVLSVNQLGKSEQIWTRLEVERIDKRLAILPDRMHNLRTLRTIYKGADEDAGTLLGKKYPEGTKIFGYSHTGNKLIVLFQTTLLHGLEKTLVHEIAHHVDVLGNASPQSSSTEFQKLSGWRGEKKKNFVNAYAAEKPVEDFAESFAYYMERPAQLKRIDLDKYNYYKNVFFNGAEFIPQTWPELETAIEQFGGAETAITQCVESLKHVQTYSGGNFIEYTSNGGVKSEAFIDHCIPQAAMDIGLFVGNFCKNGGPKTIAKILEDRWLEPLVELNEALKNALPNRNWLISSCNTGTEVVKNQCVGHLAVGSITKKYKTPSAENMEQKVGELIRRK